MRNILALVFLAVLLTGCQYSTDRRNPPPANTSWNDQNSASRSAHRQPPTRANDPADFGPGRMAGNDPDMEDPGPPPNRRQLRRAYRQALARADDPAAFGPGRMATDSPYADGFYTDDPASSNYRNRRLRRADRPPLDLADDSAALGPGRMAADGSYAASPYSEEPTQGGYRNRQLRRADRQALNSTDDDDGAFGEGRRASGLSRGASLPPGFKTVTLQHDGRERSYLLYVPASYRSGQPTPLVMVFHGGGGNAYNMVRKTRMDRLAERNNFIVVYPNGTGARDRRLTWNTGSTTSQGYAESNNVDDIGFVKTILQQVKQSYIIDSKRIYATGLSKGAMFSYRLACELSDQLAAVAPVAGSLTYTKCQPAQAVAVLHIHGSNDQNVPLEGGRGAFSARSADYPSALEGIDRWRQRNHCAATPTQTTVTADTKRYAYSGCESSREVTYYVVRGGGHGWPGATPNRKQRERGVYISNQLNASEEIWKFFAAHPKP